MRTIILLVISNVFMTYAWYGHLKDQGPDSPLWKVILLSWGIAFFEYCFMIPANRLGIAVFGPFQLKVIQEVISLLVFAGFAYWFLKEPLKWNYAVSFVFILLAVYFMFKK